MKIPKSFKLMGQTITITWNSENFVEHPDVIAFACYRKNEIQMNPNLGYKTEEQQYQSFLHEVMHFIFWITEISFEDGKGSIHSDERLVNLTANLLHQALITMVYEDAL